MKPRPLVTLYRPQRSGDRWIARADINAKGEKIELQATASDRLMKHAHDWYNRASSWMRDDRVEFRGHNHSDKQRVGKGVFCDLPAICDKLIETHTCVDEDIERALDLHTRCIAGDPVAIEQVEWIAAMALYDPSAADACEHLECVRVAMHERETLPMEAILHAAVSGDVHARKCLAALQATKRGGAPVRLEWSVDDYTHEHDTLTNDLRAATTEQIGQRLVHGTPPRSHFRRVRPSLRRRARSAALQMPMLRTFQQINRAYTI